jgi:hypothetical protein
MGKYREEIGENGVFVCAHGGFGIVGLVLSRDPVPNESRTRRRIFHFFFALFAPFAVRVFPLPELPAAHECKTF